eukprot:Opistho-2@94589
MSVLIDAAFRIAAANAGACFGGSGGDSTDLSPPTGFGGSGGAGAPDASGFGGSAGVVWSCAAAIAMTDVLFVGIRGGDATSALDGEDVDGDGVAGTGRVGV